MTFVLRSSEDLIALIARDSERMRLLKIVSKLGLPDAWIGAGFIRNLVWDALHGYSASTPLADIDVVYFDPAQTHSSKDLELEERLLEVYASASWQVRNQARMHLKNGDAPYTQSSDAISRWPETATAIAARLTQDETIELLAPLGFEDLINLRVCPTPHFAASPAKMALFRERILQKAWQRHWPKLQFEA